MGITKGCLVAAPGEEKRKQSWEARAKAGGKEASGSSAPQFYAPEQIDPTNPFETIEEDGFRARK